MKNIHIVKPPGSKLLKAGKIELQPGEDVGEHKTDRREEIIIVLKGTATLIKEGEEITMKRGDSHYIQEGITHNVKNLSKSKTEYMYVVCGLQCFNLLHLP